MSRTLMIILLVVCVIVLIVVISAVIPRVKDLLARTPLIVYIGLVVALIAVVAWLAIGVFGPKGSDSLLSADVEGVEQGDAEVKTQLEDKEGLGTHMSIEDALQGNEQGDDTIYISIRGTEIKIGETIMENAVDTMTAVRSLSADEDIKFCLVDDYAVARTYKEVKEKLDETGIRYSEKQN